MARTGGASHEGVLRQTLHHARLRVSLWYGLACFIGASLGHVFENADRHQFMVHRMFMGAGKQRLCVHGWFCLM